MRRAPPPPALLALLLLALPARGPLAAPPRVSAPASRLVLGRDGPLELEVDAEGRAPLRAAASTGRLDALDAAGTRWRFTPPDVRYPLLALLAFWVDAPPGPPEVALLRLPLLGRTTLDVTTEPGAQVVVVLGQERFGPVRADRRGRAQVPLEVPPGVRRAQVLATTGEQRSERAMELDVPEQHPALALISPEPLPRADGGYLRIVRAADAPAGGEPTVEGARLEPLAPDLFRLLPPPGAEMVDVEVPTGPQQPPVRTRARVVGPPGAWAGRAPLQGHLLAGGFGAGGASRGLALALGAAGRAPSWPRGLAVEAEVGLRRAALRATVPGLGQLRSRLVGFPLLVGARLALARRGALALHARGGVGLVPLLHDTRSDFQPAHDERALSAEAYVGLQGAFALGRAAALAELRLAHSPVHTSRLDAQLGGVMLLLGARYAP